MRTPEATLSATTSIQKTSPDADQDKKFHAGLTTNESSLPKPSDGGKQQRMVFGEAAAGQLESINLNAELAKTGKKISVASLTSRGTEKLEISLPAERVEGGWKAKVVSRENAQGSQNLTAVRSDQTGKWTLMPDKMEAAGVTSSRGSSSSAPSRRAEFHNLTSGQSVTAPTNSSVTFPAVCECLVLRIDKMDGMSYFEHIFDDHYGSEPAKRNLEAQFNDQNNKRVIIGGFIPKSHTPSEEISMTVLDQRDTVFADRTSPTGHNHHAFICDQLHSNRRLQALNDQGRITFVNFNGLWNDDISIEDHQILSPRKACNIPEI